MLEGDGYPLEYGDIFYVLGNMAYVNTLNPLDYFYCLISRKI